MESSHASIVSQLERREIDMWVKKTEVISFRDFMNKDKCDIDFFILQLQKEVKRNPQQALKIKKSLSQTLTVFVSFLTLTHPALATNGLPAEIDAALLKIQLICLGISAGLAVICLMLAGMFKMFGLSSKAQTWTWDIIKGLIQVLVAPVAVGIIVSTGRILLKPFSSYVPF